MMAPQRELNNVEGTIAPSKSSDVASVDGGGLCHPDWQIVSTRFANADL
jgi:hypothetical protein